VVSVDHRRSKIRHNVWQIWLIVKVFLLWGRKRYRIPMVFLSIHKGSTIETIGWLWTRDGFPRAFLAASDSDSIQWREGFVRTFLERDIPQLGITIPAETLRRFWTMVAHYHGQIWNAAEFARSLGTAENTARRYLDILAGSYMVRILNICGSYILEISNMFSTIWSPSFRWKKFQYLWIPWGTAISCKQ